ncbi:SH3 domain-containing protein [Rutstroemia sp. NJR-2017a WRK4]|nr:SH3 domain-containing protein [Rutstroemia sp. NJR-2017a WRK4]
MPLGINNPLPSSMASECKKCGKILASFVDPRQAFGPDKIIPPHVLAQAKGLAIVTVLKAGFLGSGRYGNGVVVARLADGSWSAPSAIGIGGGGFGGQIGFELTDFVFILNDAAAVRTFSQAGSLTLGGNVSIAAGPVGRNAEAAGAASLKGVAGVFSYSKTKGLFAGVSIEGSMIIERRDANEKLYGRRFTAAELLGGAVRAPPAAQPLMSILNSKVFAGISADDGIYNDIPVYDERHDDVVWEGRRGSAYGEGMRRDRTGSMGTGGGANDDYVYSDRPKRASTWADDIYDRQPTGGASASRNRSGTTGFVDDYVYTDAPSPRTGKVGPGRPAAPKPMFTSKTAGLKSNEAVAQFTFDADQPGDLGFKKGDIITVTKKTESNEDWWTGTIGGRTGIFPSNYVKMRE